MVPTNIPTCLTPWPLVGIPPEATKSSTKSSFRLWNMKMNDSLVQQGFHKKFDGKRKKPVSMTGDECKDLDARDLNTIRFCLVDDVLFNIVREKTTTILWSILESPMNRIYMKRQLYSL
jgi:hypothetical protein